MRNCRLLISFTLLISLAGLVQAEQLNVVASILPIADWAKNVGGSQVNVSCVLAAGSSPHTFTPTPSDVKKLARADVFVMIGLGLEEWARDFVVAAAKESLLVVELGERIGSKHGDNPHVWLDPVLAQKMVRQLAEVFAQVAPANAKAFAENADNYVKQVQSLHERFAKQFAGLKGRSVVQFHPAFSYLLKRYGLAELAVIEPHPGKEPTAKHLQQIIKKLREEPVRVILIEPQLSSKAAAAVAREASALLVEVDPLGDWTIPSKATYLSLMESNLNLLAASLR